MLTAIATSKSTVLGLRLDHDRRAWIEDTAAQQGVSVRAVFEALIDRARTEEAAFNSFLGGDEPGTLRNGTDVGSAAGGPGPAPRNAGRIGPVGEGFVGLLIGVGVLMLVCFWIGDRQ